jgi:intracellular proteinase inhibitor BsuPI
LLVAACVREPSPQQSVRDSTPQPSVGAAMTTGADSLRLEIEAPAQVRPGDRARITLRARNAGAAPLQLYLRGRIIAFDFVLRREDGTVAWQRLADQMIPAIVQVKVLGPGDTLEFADAWDGRTGRGAPLPPGHYTLEGLLLRDQPEPFRSAPVPVEVLPPSP